jgi:hypothetical protein
MRKSGEKQGKPGTQMMFYFHFQDTSCMGYIDGAQAKE